MYLVSGCGLLEENCYMYNGHKHSELCTFLRQSVHNTTFYYSHTYTERGVLKRAKKGEFG